MADEDANVRLSAAVSAHPLSVAELPDGRKRRASEVRGLAYSQLGHSSEAAAEFQTIVDHPGLVLNDPIGPMARLQLARALSASGDHARSASIYADLLVLWKNADPDIPVRQG
jgi:hypothetical protein